MHCRHGVDENPLQEIEESKNQSAVYVGIDGYLAGIIYVEDQIREDAKHVVESLSNQGISTYLLSGDKKNAAEYVASVVGIPKDNVSYSFLFLFRPMVMGLNPRGCFPWDFYFKFIWLCRITLGRDPLPLKVKCERQGWGVENII